MDVDGVISLFGFPAGAEPPGRFHQVDGIPHCIGTQCGARVNRLLGAFEVVWATGWEERANEHLPWLLGLPGELPTLRFDGRAIWARAHWKIDAIDEYAGDRPAAWIDDSFDEECYRWAEERPAPTLLVRTDPPVGIDEEHVQRLLAFAENPA